MPAANDPVLDTGLFELFDAIQRRLHRLEISRPDAAGPIAGGGTSLILADEGADLPVRARAAFQGAGVTATDDPANNRTKVTIPGTDITMSDLNAHKGSADHDGRYYTETEVNALLSSKADVGTAGSKAFAFMMS